MKILFTLRGYKVEEQNNYLFNSQIVYIIEIQIDRKVEIIDLNQDLLSYNEIGYVPLVISVEQS